MQASNPKNQAKFDKALKYNKLYDHYNDLRDKAENEGNKKEHAFYDKKCATNFDKYLEVLETLPKADQKKLSKL